MELFPLGKIIKKRTKLADMYLPLLLAFESAHKFESIVYVLQFPAKTIVIESP